MTDVKTTPVAEVVKVYTSEKLTEIKSAQSAKLAALRSEENEEVAFELNTELFKLKQDERAELARLKAEDLKAEIEAKRAAKVAELTKLVDLAIANDKVASDKKATAEDKDAAKLAFDAQFDAIANQILGSVPKVATAAKVSGEGKAGAQKGQIVELYKGYRSSGMAHTEAMKAVIEQNGVSRGSAWGPIDAYRKETGDK